MPKLAAVTGATGFIGRHVVSALRRRGWDVRVLARRHPAELLSPYHRFEVVLGDLADAPALEKLVAGADAIIHLGGLVKALRREDFYSANEAGTERLLQAAATAAPSAMLVHVSSLAAREPRPFALLRQQAPGGAEGAGAGRRPDLDHPAPARGLWPGRP